MSTSSTTTTATASASTFSTTGVDTSTPNECRVCCVTLHWAFRQCSAAVARPAESLNPFKSSLLIGLTDADIASLTDLEVINGFIANYVYNVRHFISTNKAKGYLDNTEWENMAMGNILLP